MACWICGCIRRRSDSDDDGDVLVGDDGDDVCFVDRMVVSLTLVLVVDVCNVCDVDGRR